MWFIPIIIVVGIIIGGLAIAYFIANQRAGCGI